MTFFRAPGRGRQLTELCLSLPSRWLAPLLVATVAAIASWWWTGPATADEASGDTQSVAAHDAAVAQGVSEDAQPLSWALETHEGVPWSLEDQLRDQRGVVVVFVGVECPIVRLYMPKLTELADKFSARGVRFVAVDSNRHDSQEELTRFAREHQLNFPLLRDVGNRVADACHAKRTPEVVLIDAQRRIAYQGRIDDQYHLGVQRSEAEHEYLLEAIESLVADQPIKTAATEPVGCLIGRLRQARDDSPVTYANQISRILADHCVRCHRPGEIAPFSLTDYDEIVGWATMINEVVHQELMPPWGANPSHGDFVNDPRLSDDEKELIRQWVDAGAPLGDPANLPPPPQFVEGWRIGKPDVVIKMAKKPYAVPATGAVPYQYFKVDPGFKEDRWIQAAECRPGNRAVVHHIIVAIAGDERESGDGESLPSDWLTATAPGAEPLSLPPGYAKRIPAGSKLFFQMHYTPNGKSGQTDLSEVGFVFADPATVKHEVATMKAQNTEFSIPPGAEDHEVRATLLVDRDVRLLSMFPHMHLRGKSFRYTAHFPDGREEILLDVPRYDFNWQHAYVPRQSVRLPSGTRLECVARFDNSPQNLANPDPTREVRWGDQTWEEMMIGYFDATLD